MRTLATRPATRCLRGVTLDAERTTAGNAAYGIADPVPNLTRVVVQGETASEWLRLDVDPNGTKLFTLTRRFLP